MKQTTLYIYVLLSLLLASCSDEVTSDMTEGKGVVTITSDIVPFFGAPATRVNVAGDEFIDGDLIRLKIICPFVSSTERGETTDTGSTDGIFLLKRSGNAWTRVLKADGFDITGSYSPSDSPNIAAYYEAQQTPYVFVASTWSEERRFIAASGTNTTSLYDHLTPVFHADQTKEKHYRASDVLWAQTFMQTGSWNIHLGFEHKMACLKVSIDDEALADTAKISSDAVLTLEGMPDIDQAEIVVGDYYADAEKHGSRYGYRQKSSCSYENNGKVLGIAVIDESAMRAQVAPLTGSPVPGGNYSASATTIANTGTYTAYKEALKEYRIIVPPCELTDSATFWLRDDSRRFKVKLGTLKFEEGYQYPIKLTLTATE